MNQTKPIDTDSLYPEPYCVVDNCLCRKEFLKGNPEPRISVLCNFVPFIETQVLDVYSHITTDMRKKAAQAIDKGIGQSETGIDESAVPRPEQHDRKPFIPKEAKCRKPGTGGVYMINDHLYEGRFTPRLANGKRKAYNVYARTREECEKLLAEMIAEVKAKKAAEKAALN